MRAGDTVRFTTRNGEASASIASPAYSRIGIIATSPILGACLVRSIDDSSNVFYYPALMEWLVDVS